MTVKKIRVGITADEFRKKLDFLYAIKERDTIRKKLPGSNPSATLRNLENNKTGKINEETVIKLAKAAGIEPHFFQLNLHDFAINVVDSHRNLFRERQLVKAQLNDYYEDYKGFYLGFMRWINHDNPQNNIYKILLKIYELNKVKQSINVAMTTIRHFDETEVVNGIYKWGFEGSMFPTSKGNFLLVLENIDNRLTVKGYVSITIVPNTDLDKGFWGIYTARPSEDINGVSKNILSSSRIYLKKIYDINEQESESDMFNELGWTNIEELTQEGFIFNISYLNNLQDNNELLSIDLAEIKTN